MAAKKQKKNKGGHPVYFTEEIKREIYKDLLKWSEKSDSYFLQAFVRDCKRNILVQYLSEWAAENKEFDDMLQKSKQILLGKVYTDSAMRKLDGTFVSRILPLIDIEYRKLRKEELKIESDNLDRKFNLYIHPDRLKAHTDDKR